MLAGFVVLVASGASVVTSLRHTVFDSYQRLFPFVPQGDPVFVVTIDERSLAEIGQWPWPRVRVAELVRKIVAQKPAVIGFDILFAEPDQFGAGTFATLIPGISAELVERAKREHSGDKMLAFALKQGKTVLAMAPLNEASPRGDRLPKVAPIRKPADEAWPFKRMDHVLLSLPELDDAAAGRGIISDDSDDGIVRRAPLFKRIGKKGEADDAIALSLSLEMLRVGAKSGVSIRDLTGGAIEATIGPFTFPAQDDGSIWLRHSKYNEHRRYIPAVEIMKGRLDADFLKDQIVLVGRTGLGSFDFKTTVLRDSVPGIELHAQLIEQLQADVNLRRPSNANLFELALMVLSGALLIWLVPKIQVLRAMMLFLTIGAALVTVGVVAFLWKDMLIDIAWPVVSSLWIFVGMLAGSLAVSDQQRRIMGEQAARMGGELMAAQRIQMGLLPNPIQVFAKETRVAVAATLEPARRVGGDFYDCFMIDKNRLFFNIADVSGKGLAAALFMASAKSQIKSALLLNPHDVSGALSNAQIELSRENPEQMFVTVFAAILDVNTGKLDYINAGHDSPFVRVPGNPVTRLEQASGPPLCVLDDFVYAGDTHQMVAGEWLFVMTDGVTEGTNGKGEFFGVARLQEILNAADAASTPDQLVALVMTRVHSFAEGSEPADDITLLSVRWG